MTADQFIASVIDQMPHGAPMRSQIALELRGHIAERTAQGQTLDEVLRQLGDPVKLAESYLSAVPLVSLPAGDRIAAKAIDWLVALLILSPAMVFCWWIAPPDVPIVLVLFLIALLCGGFVLGVYTAIAESGSGQTVGKRMLGARVVRESGARISGGQAVVRQLPIVLQVIWIDALFALFTDRSQRAFELLSKTRVVRVEAAS